MRKINKIVIHCTDTPEGRDVSVKEIKRWHVEENGWSDIGYHFIVDLDGETHPGRPVSMAGAHVAGHNRDSIGIVYVGGRGKDGKPKDTRTSAQIKTIQNLIRILRNIWTDIPVHGHNEFSNKACPSFNVQDENWD